uniref:Vacuolar amino acid transporter 1-like n=1 Tax=Nicotiana tabacum TaxID=4097 RepID=A0A1S4C531_TOBAC|nr:PREDICTED: vacuolar amino acid transporter 1-like [Nicotiana tabacum]
MSASQTINTYADIGQFAFGKKGKILISTFMYLELYLVAVEFLILEGDNFQKLFPNANIHIGDLKIGGKETFVMLVALIILPTTWLRSLGLLAYVSLGGVLASIVLVCVVFWIGAVDGVGFQEKDIFPCRKSKPMSYFIRTVLVISTVIVALVVPFFEYVMTFIVVSSEARSKDQRTATKSG